MSLIKVAVSSLKWSLLSELASKIFPPMVFLCLARLVAPEDFGVLASASVIISFSTIFSDAGLAKALIQRQTDIEESSNVVFWISLIIGCLVTLLIFLSAPLIASFFRDDRIERATQWLSLQVLLSSITAVHTALLQKNFLFKKLFFLRLLTSVIPGLMSIPLAFLGLGYWALIIGSLFSQIIHSYALWRACSWRPTYSLKVKIAAALLSFGKWNVLSGVLYWFYTWADTIVVGRFLGVQEVGLFRTGNTIAGLFYTMLFGPLLPVLYSLVSRVQNDHLKLKHALLTVAQAIALLGIPFAVFLFSWGSNIGNFLLGSRWEGVGLVIGTMAIGHSFSWVVGVNSEVYRAMGKPQIESWATGIMLPLYFSVYLFSVRYGLYFFLLARVSLTIAACILHIYIANVILKTSTSRWLIIFLAPLSIAAGNSMLIQILCKNFNYLLQSLLYVFLVSMTLFALNIKYIHELYLLIKRPPNNAELLLAKNSHTSY